MDAVSRDGTLSVGRAYESNAAFSVSHPLYRALSDVIESKVAELSAQKGVARFATTVSLVTLALDSEEIMVLSRLYPEFRMVPFPFSRPAHAMFTQLRRLSLEWTLLEAKKLSSSVAVFGSALVASLQSGFDRSVLVADAANAVAVHERHQGALDAYRLYAAASEVASATNMGFSRAPYDRFLRREGCQVVTAVEDVGSVDTLCVDGCLYPLSPWQVAMSMVATEAAVAVGFFPYHPVMLTDASGELPGFDVHFERTSDSVNFKYPNGVAGVTSYPLDVWRSWLVGHTFSVGTSEPEWFQLELLKNRGCVMFYRLVRLPCEPEERKIVHALDLGHDVPMYVITSKRLVSLTANPFEARSWTTSSYFFSQRLVDRVYQFAMQLPKEQFTRFALRKQVHKVNDRVTIEGTSVKVNSALGERMVSAVVLDVFSRAFVDRFDAGTLTERMRKYVDEFSGFAGLSRSEKLWYVATTCAMAAWEVTLAPLNHTIRMAADALRDWLKGSPALGKPKIEVAPSYVLVDGCNSDLDLVGGELAARELDRRAARGCTGFLSEFVRTIAELKGEERDLEGVCFRVETFALFSAVPAKRAEVDEAVDMIRGLNPLDEAPAHRRSLEVASVTRAITSEGRSAFTPVADPVYTLNEFYDAVLPGVSGQDLEFDTASISLDPQDRTLVAPYMRLPKYFGDAPRPKAYFRSRLRALNVPKRQQTLQELLSAIAARNLNAPQVALPQDETATANIVWENFLDKACVPDARDKLLGYQRDPVALSEDGFREWVEQSTPDKLRAVKRELEEQSRSLAEMDVHEYLVMLKSDVKPTLSVKPLDTRTEPQVIVYHEKALSALFSCVFRVLVRRFLALLKPNYHVNLLKDTRDIESFVRGVHPFGVSGLKYLENDFSKYDKSQGKFVFTLEELVFTSLGMNHDLLSQWLGGHVECSLRAVNMGLSLHVLYQRKSGDATTSFGNVILNVLSVTYAYKHSEVLWALFMGDDSLVCAKVIGQCDDAVAILAEVFNLGAKTYLTDAPYFASNFVLVDDINRDVHFIADPVKRIERWSMAVSAEDPQWHERYISAKDSLSTYMSCSKTVLLPKVVAERYGVEVKAVYSVADSIATVLEDEGKFRKMWEDKPEMSLY